MLASEDHIVGQMEVPPPLRGQATLDTLDEPVLETIMRDGRQIAKKLRYVLLPSGTENELKNWDLWGPLLLCLVLAISLSLEVSDSKKSITFAAVFVVVWAGSGVVTLNASLLGGKISFFQSVCVLGYCIFPLVITAFVIQLLKATVIKLIVMIVAFTWSTRASVGFMQQLVPSDRKLLGVYPVFLFFVTLAWMILVVS